jgi:hypothetical protein
MMDGYQAYRYFMAIKLHFTTDKYDVFEKNGRVTGKRTTFDSRNDRGLFEKLANKFSKDKDLIQYFAANFAYGNNGVIYSTDSDDYYDVWIKRKQSMGRIFEIDMLTIQRHLENNKKQYDALYSIDDHAPELLSLYLGKKIALESMVILNDLENYLDKWEPLIMLWNDEFRLIRKVKKFVKYNPDVVKSIYNRYKEEMQ